MIPTGQVRRVDDLGRINIPRGVRKILKIHENDRMEIFYENDGTVILKPYKEDSEV